MANPSSNSVVNSATPRVYYGFSTDTLPTTNLNGGDLYFYRDTNVLQQWSGAAWVPVSYGSGTPGQLPGTTTNDNASAGNVGEYVVSQVLQAAQVNAPSAGFTTVTTISLTAGDWDISGYGAFQPAATTSYTLLRGGISSASGSLNIPDGFWSFIASAQIDSTSQGIGFALPPVRASLNATTTYYLIVTATYTVSTMGAYGTIRARRVR